MAVAVDWFEIPVTDMDRAVVFYAAVIGEPMGTMANDNGIRRRGIRRCKWNIPVLV